MKRGAVVIGEIASNPYFIVVGAACSIASFMWFVYDKLNDKLNVSDHVLSLVSFCFAFFVLLLGIFYSIQIRLENKALRDIAATFNEINEIYKGSLKGVFGKFERRSVDVVDFFAEEEKVLRSVCQRIQNIFSRVTTCDCMVTVKLHVTKDGLGFAETYVRGIENCIRDIPSSVKYEVGTGKNTAFDEALIKKPAGIPSHFFSPDLTKEKNYANERPHFGNFYQSTIVVPIRGVNRGDEGKSSEYDLIGFLTVDTKSVNKLNGGYQLQMVCSLASQMYNYISLMRGKYSVKAPVLNID